MSDRLVRNVLTIFGLACILGNLAACTPQRNTSTGLATSQGSSQGVWSRYILDEDANGQSYAKRLDARVATTGSLLLGKVKVRLDLPPTEPKSAFPRFLPPKIAQGLQDDLMNSLFNVNGTIVRRSLFKFMGCRREIAKLDVFKLLNTDVTRLLTGNYEDAFQVATAPSLDSAKTCGEPLLKAAAKGPREVQFEFYVDKERGEHHQVIVVSWLPWVSGAVFREIAPLPTESVVMLRYNRNEKRLGTSLLNTQGNFSPESHQRAQTVLGNNRSDVYDIASLAKSWYEGAADGHAGMSEQQDNTNFAASLDKGIGDQVTRSIQAIIERAKQKNSQPVVTGALFNQLYTEILDVAKHYGIVVKPVINTVGVFPNGMFEIGISGFSDAKDLNKEVDFLHRHELVHMFHVVQTRAILLENLKITANKDMFAVRAEEFLRRIESGNNYFELEKMATGMAGSASRLSSTGRDSRVYLDRLSSFMELTKQGISSGKLEYPNGKTIEEVYGLLLSRAPVVVGTGGWDSVVKIGGITAVVFAITML